MSGKGKVRWTVKVHGKRKAHDTHGKKKRRTTSIPLLTLASGSVRILYKSSSVSPLSSTRIGNRPCSSGSMSLGFTAWKAPDAMKSM